MSRPRVPPARSQNAVIRILRALWTLPTNLIGHALGLLATRSRPTRLGGRAASASLYMLRSSPLARALGAIAIGNVILAESDFIFGTRGRWILAHELSHTRQHTWLGPLYLPIHAFWQILSTLVSMIRPVPVFPPQHAYNPLERVFLCVPFDTIANHTLIADDQRDEIWEAFGLVT